MGVADNLRAMNEAIQSILLVFDEVHANLEVGSPPKSGVETVETPKDLQHFVLRLEGDDSPHQARILASIFKECGAINIKKWGGDALGRQISWTAENIPDFISRLEVVRQWFRTNKPQYDVLHAEVAQYEILMAHSTKRNRDQSKVYTKTGINFAHDPAGGFRYEPYIITNDADLVDIAHRAGITVTGDFSTHTTDITRSYKAQNIIAQTPEQVEAIKKIMRDSIDRLQKSGQLLTH